MGGVGGGGRRRMGLQGTWVSPGLRWMWARDGVTPSGSLPPSSFPSAFLPAQEVRPAPLEAASAHALGAGVACALVSSVPGAPCGETELLFLGGLCPALCWA